MADHAAPAAAAAAGLEPSSGAAAPAPPSHMPPPLSIPPNHSSVPAVGAAPNGAGAGVMSPTSAGGVRRAAPEPNKRALYVGGLDPRVTEDVLKQIFETTGHVQSVKIIPDKNVSRSRTHARISVLPQTGPRGSKRHPANVLPGLPDRH